MADNYLKLFDKISRAIDKLPTRIGTCAVNFSKRRFVEQNWHNNSPEPWKPRSANNPRSKQRKKGAILVSSGRLKRSLRVTAANSKRIVISTDVPYAEVHNEGFSRMVNVRAHSRTRAGRKIKIAAHTRNFKMPERRFLGESAELNKQIEDLIVSEIKNAIK